jgi:hypothetical protein
MDGKSIRTCALCDFIMLASMILSHTAWPPLVRMLARPNIYGSFVLARTSAFARTHTLPRAIEQSKWHPDDGNVKANRRAAPRKSNNY